MKKQFVIIKWFGGEPIMTDFLFDKRSDAEKAIEEWFKNEKIGVGEKKSYSFTIDKVYAHEYAT